MSASIRSEKQQDKIIAAILAGVAAFIDEEQISQTTAPSRQRPAIAFNHWSMSGREELMRMRAMWQRRIT